MGKQPKAMMGVRQKTLYNELPKKEVKDIRERRPKNSEKGEENLSLSLSSGWFSFSLYNLKWGKEENENGEKKLQWKASIEVKAQKYLK